MSSNIGDLVATATLDIAPFISNTKNLKTHMKSLDNSLKAVEKSYKSGGDKLNGLRAIYNQTGRSLTGYQSLLSKQTAHYNKLKADIGDVNKATAEQKSQLLGAQSAMTATASKVAELQSKYNSLGKEIAIQSSVFTRVGDKMQSVGGKLQTVGDSAQSVGRSFTKGLTTPIVAGAGLAIKAAVDYESAFAGVRKTVDASEAGYRKLSDGIRQMAKEMPASAAEIAHVAETAGQLGIKQNDILGFTKTMIDMRKSTNLSADEAATSIAKIGNILGLTSAEYSRFGSSVVALGNNFATTEKDVVEMSNRLAASGKLAGLTAPEILGLATAMSSVGIEAEAGGTAMSQTLTQIGQAVDTGGDKLNKLAEIAGMTAEQFSAKWKEKPIEAVEAFIKGLGNLGNEGESASSVLDELGMSGIRQSNMLKALGLASDKVSGAVKMSSEAWKENSALTDEAAKRYETTQSKLKILKNKATDVAIELGGPLADALTDALEAGEPLIENIADLAKQFSSLDKEQQQQIIKWGLIAAGIGPALSIFGKASSVIGGTIGAFGKLSSGIGKISGMAKAATTIGAIGTASESAAGSAGAMASAVGLLGSPVTWGVLLGGAALLAIGTWAEKANEARQRTEEWGTEVSATEANELTKFKTKVDETNQAMAAFGSEGSADVEKIKEAFKGLTDEINKLTDKQLAKDLKLAEKLGFSDEEIQKIKDRAAETKEVTNKMADDVVKIYQRASDNHRELTETEREIVKSAQNAMIEEKLALMGKEKDETIAIRKAMNGEVNELNQKQAAKGLATVKSWIEEENKAYKKQKADLKDFYKRGVIDKQKYHRELEKAEANHKAVMEGYEEQYLELQKKVAEEALKNSNPEARKAILNTIKDTMDKLGVSYDKFTEKMRGASQTAAETSSLVGEYWQGMSEEARTAVDYWNSIILDPVTGEVKTNAQEEIQKALQAEGGWEAMQLSLKEGRMTTDAKIAVGEALIETGKWEALSPSEKELVTNNKPALEAIFESETMLNQWNALPVGVKKILGENNSFLNSKEAATNALNTWNLLQPHQKELIAKDLASEDVNVAQQAINQLTGKTVIIDANNETGQAALEANLTVNGVKHEAPIGITAEDKTAEASTSAQTNVNLPYQLKPIDMFGADKTTAAVTQTNKSVNSPKQNSPIGMFGANKTGPAVTSAKSSVNSVKQNNPTSIKAKNDTGDGVSRALNSLSQIPAVKWVSIQAKKIGDFLGLKNGTNYHQGGPAIVNDQKGPTYKELVTLPSGQSFIPQGRDVMLPLPRGSKVLKASETKKLFPHYADGIGFEKTNISRLAQRMGTVNSGVIVEQQVNQDNDLRRLIFELVDAIKNSNNDKAIAQALDIAEQAVERPVNLYLQDGSWMGRVADRLTKHQSNKTLINNRLKGEI